VSLACAFLVMGTLCAAADPAADMKAAIERATSLAEVRAAYLRLKPTAADLARVAKALEGTTHATRLAELARQADARSKALAHRQQSIPPTLVLVDATARLGRLNQQARAGFAAAAHTGVGGAARRPAPTRLLTPELDATMLGAGAASDPDAPRIQMLLPRVIEVGGELTITGQRFGAARGRIDFEFAGLRIAGEVDGADWTDTAIHVRLGDLRGCSRAPR
jgi:hypothetical protein